ncbi:DUF4189 domain-containing protein [Lysobacter alkalisoli]|uniref:DUF4189 domain-containing protein n=1 Tax=Marilutibacter alkalisoli TaxID=2591633 RepID=A0A514BVC5_9GAMM|nr:DUF4189 domain-containing protein [Lysobacter alkalisoli]
MVQKARKKLSALRWQTAKQREGACQVLITYDNQCGVLIVGDKFLGTARARTKEIAEDIGVEACQVSDTNCEVYYSACTEPVFHRY